MADRIRLVDGALEVPDRPALAYIAGDGIGSDISPAMRRVVDSAVEAAYGGARRIAWQELLAGEKAYAECGQHLPQQTLEGLREHVVGIKGPLTTPVGGGFRSLNVAIRQALDLYSCIRPVKWYGSASPLRHPEQLDLVVFRENTEDVYAGVEYEAGSPECRKLLELLGQWGVGEAQVAPDSALGLKPISQVRSKRHVRKALRYARAEGRRRVTLMHKGNIMKHTEGAFLRWGYEVCEEPEFAGHFARQGQDSGGRIPVDDRIADNMFQQILTRSADYDLIVTTNLNGDLLSDAAAAAVGGLGMAPGGNVGDGLAVFEATHGSAPKYAGQDKVNPSSLILSAAMMLDYIGWGEAAGLVRRAVERTLAQRRGTYDLVRGWRAEPGVPGAPEPVELGCAAYAEALAENLAAGA